MTGPFSTRADLVIEALGSLNAIGTGQIPDVEDVDYITGKVDSTLRMLAGLEICYIPDADNIPNLLLMPLASILASVCAEKFSPSPDDFNRMMQMGLGHPPGSGQGAMAIKQIMRGRPTFEPLRVLYF